MAFSGASGNLIRRMDAPPGGSGLGRLLARPADLDGDGFLDFVGQVQFQSDHHYGFLVLSRWDGSIVLERRVENGTYLALATVGDLNGNGVEEILLGNGGDSRGPRRRDTGRVTGIGFDPFLHASRHSLSPRPGDRVLLDLAFPATEAGLPYLLLGSTTGKGPTALPGVEVPLGNDALFRRMIRRNPPRNFLGAHGILDSGGRAGAAVQGAAALSDLIGRTLFLAAITQAPNGRPRLSSAATTVTIVP